MEVAQQDEQRWHVLQSPKACKLLKRSELGRPNQPRLHRLQPEGKVASRMDQCLPDTEVLPKPSSVDERRGCSI